MFRSRDPPLLGLLFAGKVRCLRRRRTGDLSNLQMPVVVAATSLGREVTLLSFGEAGTQQARRRVAGAFFWLAGATQPGKKHLYLSTNFPARSSAVRAIAADDLRVEIVGKLF